MGEELAYLRPLPLNPHPSQLYQSLLLRVVMLLFLVLLPVSSLYMHTLSLPLAVAFNAL